MDPRKIHRQEYWSRHDKQSYNCPECGRGFDEVTEFQVHHIDGNASNGNPDNLVALCVECHHDQHGFWIRQFTPAGIHEKKEKIVGAVLNR